MSQSDRPGTIRIDRIIEQDGRYETRTYRLPVVRLDNRVDKTTFVRVPRAQWRAEDVKALRTKGSRARLRSRAVDCVRWAGRDRPAWVGGVRGP